MSAGHTELLPCPFCGGEAELLHEDAMRGLGKSVSVWCPNCGARTGKSWSGNREAIAAWNTRAIEAAEADLLGKALEALRMVSSIRPANWDDGEDDEMIASFNVVDAVLSQAREVK